MKITKKIEIMKNVEISISFEEFEPLTLKTKNGVDVFIFDFEQAIDIARSMKLSNIQLRQDSNGGAMEWDNF